MHATVLRALAIAVFLAGGLLTFFPRALVAQFGVRVRWPLMDLLVRGDSAGTLLVLTSPNLSSTLGSTGTTKLRSLALQPVEAMQWATVMRQLVDSAGDRPRVPAPRPLFPLLKQSGDKGAMQLAIFGEKGQPPYGFAVAGDSAEAAWQVRVTAGDVRKLLDALVDVGGAAAFPERRAIRLAVRDEVATCPVPPDAVAGDLAGFEAPFLLSTDGLNYPRRAYPRKGRVWMQFVIDSTGAVARGSECVLLTDGIDFTDAVLERLPKARFRPGRLAGASVATLVFIEFRFVPQRP